jgi:low affinity Fe/Cu permease
MSKHFVRFANRVAETSGYPSVFAVAVSMVLVWLATGPIFRFSDTWQLIMNTLTSVITFLMVFLIQTSQNRDSTALQAKLDELIRASSAQNLFVGLEQMSTEEIAKNSARGPWASRTTEESDGRIAQPSDQSVPCASPEVSIVFVVNKRL